MKLQTKITIRFWLCTAFIFFPAVLCVLFMLVFLKLDSAKSNEFMNMAYAMMDWRNENVRWYVIDQTRGYSLEIE